MQWPVVLKFSCAWKSSEVPAKRTNAWAPHSRDSERTCYHLPVSGPWSYLKTPWGRWNEVAVRGRGNEWTEATGRTSAWHQKQGTDLQLLAPSAFPPLPLVGVDPGGLDLEGFGRRRLPTSIWGMHLWVGSPQRHPLLQPAARLGPPVVLSLMWSPLLPVGFRELGCGEVGYEESEDDICGASPEAHVGVWPDERRMGGIISKQVS